MSHVTLIVPPGQYTPGLGYDRYLHTPLESITSLRSVLIQAGHRVRVHDYRAFQTQDALSLLSDDVSAEANIVGFTSFFDSFLFIEQAIAILRSAHCKATIVVGGPTPSALPSVFLLDARADVVAVGEAEESIAELAAVPLEREQLANISGIAWKSTDDRILVNPPSPFPPLDALPECDWSYIDHSEQINPMYSAGRGCSGRCSFCARKMAPKRFRSPERFAQDLAHIYEVTGETYILLNDSDFLHDNPYLNEYCSILKRMSLKWSCLASPYSMTPELLEHLFDCGCRNIRVGIEAHDEEMIRQHRIGFDLIEMNHILDMLEACPIPQVTGYYVLGLPDQSPESLNVLLKEARRRKRIAPRSFQLLPLPGAPVFETAVERQLVKDIPSYLRSLESVHIEVVSSDIPNLSACSYSMLAEVHQELASMASSRILASGSVAFP